MRGPVCAIVCRDVRLSVARGSEAVGGIFFFVITGSMFAIALGGDTALLQKSAAAVIWMSALLAALLSLENIFHRDLDDGTFDQLFLSVSPATVMFAKATAHWIVAGLPLVLAALIVGPMLFLPTQVLCAMTASLLLGTGYASLLGALGAGLTAGSRRPGLLLGILILPLYVPMLLLGISVVDAAASSLPVKPYLLLQLALVIAAAPLAILGAGALFNMHLKS